MELKRLGVRLHHPTLRNCTFTIEQQNVIYPEPFQCPMCEKKHIFKTFHLQLNQHGDVCVDPYIYEMFKQSGMVGELTATKEVTPAPTFLFQGGDPTSPIIVSREFGNIRLPGMNGHGRT